MVFPKAATRQAELPVAIKHDCQSKLRKLMFLHQSKPPFDLQCQSHSLKDCSGPDTHGPCRDLLVLHCHQCATRRNQPGPRQAEGEVTSHLGCLLHLVASCSFYQLQVRTILAADSVHKRCLGKSCTLSKLMFLALVVDGLVCTIGQHCVFLILHVHAADPCCFTLQTPLLYFDRYAKSIITQCEVIRAFVLCVQILWTYILSQAAAATVSAAQPVSKGEEPEPLTFPQQVAVFLPEEEQIAAMQLVVEELASNPSPEELPAEPASAK